MNPYGDPSDLTTNVKQKVPVASAAKIATQESEQGEGGDVSNVFTTPRPLLRDERHNVDSKSGPSPPSTSPGFGPNRDGVETSEPCSDSSSYSPHVSHFFSPIVGGRPLGEDEDKMAERISMSREIVGDLGDRYVYLNRRKGTALSPPKGKKNSD